MINLNKAIITVILIVYGINHHGTSQIWRHFVRVPHKVQTNLCEYLHDYPSVHLPVSALLFNNRDRLLEAGFAKVDFIDTGFKAYFDIPINLHGNLYAPV